MVTKRMMLVIVLCLLLTACRQDSQDSDIWVEDGDCERFISDHYEIEHDDTIDHWMLVGDRWKDGSRRWEKIVPFSDCRTGEKVGENTNLLYCKPMYAHRREVSDAGIILEDNYYEINLRLQKNDLAGIETQRLSTIFIYPLEGYDCRKLYEKPDEYLWD